LCIGVVLESSSILRLVSHCLETLGDSHRIHQLVSGPVSRAARNASTLPVDVVLSSPPVTTTKEPPANARRVGDGFYRLLVRPDQVVPILEPRDV
jgi:hypothetical protein